jgi:elongation factor Ts
LKQAEEDAKAELKAEPEQIWDKIIPGKVQVSSRQHYFRSRKALLDQNFIKDDSKKSW